MAAAAEVVSPMVPSSPRGVPGAKLFRSIQEHLAPLKELPAHGNRTLHFYPLIVTLVTSFYDPLMRSLRAIEARSSNEPITGADVQRMARSTTSDALAAFDPELLKGVISNLHKQVPQLASQSGRAGGDACLEGILKKIVAADGSYFSIFADVVWALHHTKINGEKQGQVRLNLQMSTADWIPQVVTLSGGEESDGSEPDAVAQDLLSNVLYVVDRNFIDFDFIRAVRAVHSDLIVRMRKNAPGYEIVQSHVLGQEDIAAGVLGDHTIRLTGRDAPKELFRLVEVRHASKPDETVKLLTNLTDLSIPARIIGQAYKQRWQIELFFRWLKVWCNFDHLLSTSRQGITTQMYVIVIATLLMRIHLGRKVSKYTLIAFRQIALGQATEQEMEQYLARRDREKDLERIRLAKKAAAKKA
jgi:Transposase DDE domain